MSMKNSTIFLYAKSDSSTESSALDLNSMLSMVSNCMQKVTKVANGEVPGDIDEIKKYLDLDGMMKVVNDAAALQEKFIAQIDSEDNEDAGPIKEILGVLSKLNKEFKRLDGEVQSLIARIDSLEEK